MRDRHSQEVHLYTSDRDFLQLVDPNIYVHIIKRGLSDVAIMTPEKVVEEIITLGSFVV